MRILAIETSCDDTAVAIVENGHRVLVSLVASQEKLHARFGGVVPEVASREHSKAVFLLIDTALRNAGIRPKDIDALAVTVGPGLLGSLMIGVNAARTLAYLWKKPLIPVNHLVGHLYSGFLKEPGTQFPVLGLLISGGHTEWVLAKKRGAYKYLGGTLDDAAGEAFDKVARVLNLGYPGGPAIAQKALGGIPGRVSLPRPMIDKEGLDVSFSGLKTAVLYLPKQYKSADVAYEFQKAVTDLLISKTRTAIAKYKPATVVLGGGVAANTTLRQQLSEALSGSQTKLVVPDLKYCMDNAAMIAAAAYFTWQKTKKYEWYNAKVSF